MLAGVWLRTTETEISAQVDLEGLYFYFTTNVSPGTSVEMVGARAKDE